MIRSRSEILVGKKFSCSFSFHPPGIAVTVTEVVGNRVTFGWIVDGEPKFAECYVFEFMRDFNQYVPEE